MNCDICGRDALLYTVLVEGSELKVCERCSASGKVIKRPEFVLLQHSQNIARFQGRHVAEITRKLFATP